MRSMEAASETPDAAMPTAMPRGLRWGMRAVGGVQRRSQAVGEGLKGDAGKALRGASRAVTGCIADLESATGMSHSATSALDAPWAMKRIPTASESDTNCREGRGLQCKAPLAS